MSQDTFYVTWKQFKAHLMVNQQELFHEKHFADVTLVSDDGTQLTAHKVILSACSSLLKNLLLNNPHPHPLLFMRGIKKGHLLSILQFMYCGEVRIPRDDIDEFLYICKDLKVEGLDSSFDINLDGTDEMKNMDNEKQENTEAIMQDDVNQGSEANSDHNDDSDVESTEFNTLTNIDFVEDIEVNQLIEPNNGLYSCDECDMKTVRRSSLKTHKDSIHGGIRYECDKCDYKATKLGNLRRHKHVKHEDPKYSYFCNHCEYKATQKEYLDRHMQSQHEVLRYSCDECAHKALSQETLNEHKQAKHEGVRYSCHLCNYQTAWSQKIKKHREVKHSIE